ncbi:transcription elongation factor GreA [Candidatus Woesebacteria bacterium]|nr:transcription elongation factor GreA [Candidatus Woesebacteria bacterium]
MLKQDPTIPFTKEAHEQLVKELHRLTIELEAVKERVRVAREMGDLSENGAYHYGKFELGSISRQLRQIQYQLKHGYILSTTMSDKVRVGNVVTISQAGVTVDYRIVSAYEADPRKGKISQESPIGQALLGKKVGDTITIMLPAGEKTYSVEKITV